MNLNARLTQHWNLMRFTTQIFSQFKYDVNLYFKKINSGIVQLSAGQPSVEVRRKPDRCENTFLLHFSQIWNLSTNFLSCAICMIMKDYTEYFKIFNIWELKDRKSQCEWRDILCLCLDVFQFLYWNRWLIEQKHSRSTKYRTS